MNMNMNKARLQEEHNGCESDSPAEDEAQERRIKTIPELTDGGEFLQLSNQKVYEAWKAFLYKVLLEIEELGLKSHRLEQVSSISDDTRIPGHLNLNDARAPLREPFANMANMEVKGANRYLVPLPLPVPVPVIRLSRKRSVALRKANG